MNIAVDLTAIENELRHIVRDEYSRLNETPSPWLNTKSAAAYLDITEDALRGIVKRGEITPSRSANRRLMFRREMLDAWAMGGEAA
jgi:hypothetical protein